MALPLHIAISQCKILKFFILVTQFMGKNFHGFEKKKIIHVLLPEPFNWGRIRMF